MKLLLLADGDSDFAAVLERCGAEITRLSMGDAIDKYLDIYDAYVILAGGKVLDPLLCVRLLGYNASVDILSIVAAILYMIAMIQKREQSIRLFLLANMSGWTVYHLIIGSTAIFVQIAGIISSLIAMYRYRKNKCNRGFQLNFCCILFLSQFFIKYVWQTRNSEFSILHFAFCTKL